MAHRLCEFQHAIRIPDRIDAVSDLQIIAAAEDGRGKAVPVDFDDSKIFFLCRANDPPDENGAVISGDGYVQRAFHRLFHNMVIGEDITVFRDQES